MTKFLYSVLFATVATAAAAQSVEKGVIDLRQNTFNSGEPVLLKGSWEFYWNQLLTPADFTLERKPSYLQVPGTWHRQGNFTALGYGTFRVRILLSSQQRDLLLYFPVINTSARFWINGELVSETGIVGTSIENYTPKLSSSVISVPPHVEQLDVIAQVANFSYYSAGLGDSPRIDNATSHMARVSRLHGVENFFAGSLIAMFIYQFILYFLYDRGKPYLWLGLICLGVALRSMIVNGGSYLLPTLFEDVPWEVWKKIEFGSVYAILAFFPLYVYHLFTRFAPRWPLWLFIGTSSVLCTAVVFTPQHVYGKLLEICHFGLLFTFIFAVYVIGNAWRKGNRDARIILWGVLASFPFILLEILKNSRLYPIQIDFMYLVELGVLVFLLFQVYLLSNHYAKAYRSLEKVVEERTEELVSANTVKDRLLSVMSHDIKSPLNSLRGILQLYQRGAISKDEFGTFTQQIESDLNKTSLLVENILHWTTSQISGIQVSLGIFSVREVVDETIHLLSSNADRKKLTVIHNVPSTLEVTTDRNIVTLVLRNLLANAIKFSFEHGAIEIEVKLEDAQLTITVVDHGMGMDQETIEKLLTSITSMSTRGTQKEQGTGIGIGLCKEYLSKLDGQLSIRSTLGNGSAFSMMIPISRS